MSSRSYICVKQNDGTYVGIYCHNFGFLTYNGAMLIDHYKKREKVEELIKYGDLSLLNINVSPDPRYIHNFNSRQKDVCVFYGRDRGEKNTEARVIKLSEINDKNSWIEYCYIYDLDNTWKYFLCGTDNINIRDLESDIIECYKNLKVTRPKGYYGYLNVMDIICAKNVS